MPRGRCHNRDCDWRGRRLIGSVGHCSARPGKSDDPHPQVRTRDERCSGCRTHLEVGGAATSADGGRRLAGWCNCDGSSRGHHPELDAVGRPARGGQCVVGRQHAVGRLAPAVEPEAGRSGRDRDGDEHRRDRDVSPLRRPTSPTRSSWRASRGAPVASSQAPTSVYEAGIVPDGVARVRWTFANATAKRTYVVDVPASNDVAITPFHAGTPFLLRATWYAPDGSVVPTSDSALRHAMAARDKVRAQRIARQDERSSFRPPPGTLADFAVFGVTSRSGIRVGDLTISHPRLSSVPLPILQLTRPRARMQFDPSDMRRPPPATASASGSSPAGKGCARPLSTRRRIRSRSATTRAPGPAAVAASPKPSSTEPGSAFAAPPVTARTTACYQARTPRAPHAHDTYRSSHPHDHPSTRRRLHLPNTAIESTPAMA